MRLQKNIGTSPLQNERSGYIEASRMMEEAKDEQKNEGFCESGGAVSRCADGDWVCRAEQYEPGGSGIGVRGAK
jgi:hypothetical protein